MQAGVIRGETSIVELLPLPQDLLQFVVSGTPFHEDDLVVLHFFGTREADVLVFLLDDAKLLPLDLLLDPLGALKVVAPLAPVRP